VAAQKEVRGVAKITQAAPCRCRSGPLLANDLSWNQFHRRGRCIPAIGSQPGRANRPRSHCKVSIGAALNILEAISDSEILGDIFKDRSTWRAWEAFLRCLFGLPLEDGDEEIWSKHTGRKCIVNDGFHEAWLVCGRRAGKSMILALCAVYLACFKDWRPYLSPGESE